MIQNVGKTIYEIDKKITSVEVYTNEPEPEYTKPENKNEKLINNIEKKLIIREEILNGKTYKVKSPLSDYSLYITINDIELDGKKYPFEIFINSKSVEHVQWIIALTRLISSVFRQSISFGNDISFIVKELKSVFDSTGGYRKSKNIIIPSLVAEIGYIIEKHLIYLNLLDDRIENNNLSEMKNLRQCPVCGSISVHRESGCDMCSNCNYTRCG